MHDNTDADYPLRFFQNFMNGHPGIKTILPTDSEWPEAKKCYINQAARPSIITQPQNATHIQELIRLCVSNNVNFVVRSGGHDCAGRSQVNGALTIDMRNIQYVHISEDKKTARIGGGILTRELTKTLSAQGLVTPTGPIASIGYVGWATLGGYGPLARKYGLGIDQIVGAQYVNAAGELVEEPTEEALAGLRGGGGSFGVITELTIKVYPLKEILEGTFIFESKDKNAAWAAYIEGYNQLLNAGPLPESLSLQHTGVAIPGMGNAFSLSAIWAGHDHEVGREWLKKIAALRDCTVNVVEATTLHAHTVHHEKMVPSGVYGRARTLNLRQLTPKTAEILARHNALIPAPGCLFSAQLHRDPTQPEKSVFAPREEHYWLEIVATALDPDAAKKADEWALALKNDLLLNDADNVLDSAYIGFLDNDELELSKVYGHHYEDLVSLKKKLDPNNVFKNSVPNLAI